MGLYSLSPMTFITLFLGLLAGQLSVLIAVYLVRSVAPTRRIRPLLENSLEPATGRPDNLKARKAATPQRRKEMAAVIDPASIYRDESL